MRKSSLLPYADSLLMRRFYRASLRFIENLDGRCLLFLYLEGNKTTSIHFGGHRGKLATAGVFEELGAIAGAVYLVDAAETNGFGGNKNLAVTIRVQADKPRSALRPIWRFFGADEPNYAYMKDGEKLLGELGELRRGSVYFRTHNLLTSGDGTPALKWGSTGAYSEDKRGNPVYNWQIVDRIFDTYLKRGVKPYAQIGFMPRELSLKPEPYQHRWTPGGANSIFTGWTYPPRDYKKWAELVFQWTSHCVQRYGRAEVETWYWQVWNEPNIGYWRGTPQEFRRLHDTAIDAVRRACLPLAWAGPTRRPRLVWAHRTRPAAHVTSASFSNTASAAPTTRPASGARRWILSRFMPRARRNS